MKITRTFERYVAPEIVDEILKEGIDNLSLGGKTCDIAVLFVDVMGFTTMSESLQPEEVVAILNQYLALTTKAVFDNMGTLDKFVGDCTMAVFNSPFDLDDYEFKSVCAAFMPSSLWPLPRIWPTMMPVAEAIPKQKTVPRFRTTFVIE